jgi:hypothetical protein
MKSSLVSKLYVLVDLIFNVCCHGDLVVSSAL